MLSLAGGAWRAALLPARGGALASLTHDGRDVLVPLPPGEDPNACWAGAFLMLPWTNRLDGGRLPFPGGVHRFSCNRAEERTALHGFGRERAWTVEEAGPDRAVLLLLAEEGPYRFRARLEVRLDDAFALTLTVTNEGADGVPFGTGWHPFFVREAGTRLTLPAAGSLTRDARNLPLASVPSAGVAGGEEAFTGLDTHFTGWSGEARLDLGGAAFVLRGEDAWSRNAQVFAPRGAGVLCVEPVSHVPDAANRPALAALGDMRRLPRGGFITGRAVLLPRT